MRISVLTLTLREQLHSTWIRSVWGMLSVVAVDGHNTSSVCVCVCVCVLNMYVCVETSQGCRGCGRMHQQLHYGGGPL